MKKVLFLDIDEMLNTERQHDHCVEAGQFITAVQCIHDVLPNDFPQVDKRDNIITLCQLANNHKNKKRNCRKQQLRLLL